MVRQRGRDMVRSAFARRQTSPLFMPEEEKGPQSPICCLWLYEFMLHYSRPAIDCPTVDSSLFPPWCVSPQLLCEETEINGENTGAVHIYRPHIEKPSNLCTVGPNPSGSISSPYLHLPSRTLIHPSPPLSPTAISF